ncbi:hypothetical protein FBU31_003226, partial [Coemansia sp. 'formosensis']
MNILRLDCVDWMHVNTLTITGPHWICKHYIESTHFRGASNMDVARTIQYFGQNLRNIVELNLTDLTRAPVGKYLYSDRATYYYHRIQVLRAGRFIPLALTHTPRNIKVLELTLDSKLTRVLPSICAETLQELKMSDVPSNFAWHYFRNVDYLQPIVFHRLTVLHLSFNDMHNALTESEIQDKIASGAHNCDQLRFPALRELAIDECTPDCNLLYADVPFPNLKRVRLSGSINSIYHCRRLKLAWVGDLDVSVRVFKSDSTADIYRATNHCFTNICIGRTASLSAIEGNLVLDPEPMQFRTYRLDFDNLTTDSFIDDLSLFSSADPLLTWGEKLAS